MSEDTATTKSSRKDKGSNKTPSQRQYNVRNTRALKRSIELFKGLYDIHRISSSQRNALSYFLVPISSGNSDN